MPSKKKTAAKTPAPSSNGARRHYNYTPEQIVRAWQTSSSAKEACGKLGDDITERALAARVFSLRKKGIPLKSMGRTSTRYSREKITELSDLATSLV